MKKKIFSAIVIFLWLLPACTSKPHTPIADSPTALVKEPVIGKVYEDTAVQVENTYNCDGASPTNTFRRSLEQEQTTVFEVVVEAGGLLREAPLPPFLEAEMEAKLKSSLQKSHGFKYQTSAEIPLVTPSGEARKHKIIWREKKVKGIIEVLYQDRIAKVSFQRIIGFELEKRTSEPLPCDITPSPSSSTPLTPTLPPTPTITPAPSLAFLENCISTRWRFWAIFPEKIVPNNENCYDLSNWGLNTTEHGLDVWVHPDGEDRHFAIYTKVPNDFSEIRLTFEIRSIERSKLVNQYLTDFYIGVFTQDKNPTEEPPLGRVMVFRGNDPSSDISILFGDRLGSEGRWTIKSDYRPRGRQTIHIQKNSHEMNFLLDGVENYNLMHLPILDSKDIYLWIGFKVPKNGEISALINDVKVLDAEN